MSASIFEMSGAALSAALASPGPSQTAVAYPGASADLRPILAAIASLSRQDQAALIRAFRKSEADKPKMIGGNTFKGWSDFTPALDAARAKAVGAFGSQWYLNPDLCVKARVPSAWTACKGALRTISTPRDMNIPAAQFWPGGVLPTGPDYAEPYQIDPSADVRVIREQQRERAETFRVEHPEWYLAAKRPAPDFALEPTPENIDELEPA